MRLILYIIAGTILGCFMGSGIGLIFFPPDSANERVQGYSHSEAAYFINGASVDASMYVKNQPNPEVNHELMLEFSDIRSVKGYLIRMNGRECLALYHFEAMALQCWEGDK